jgi:hypothetical protein
VGWLAVLTLLAFSYNFAACLEAAIITTFDNPRYSTALFCCTVLAEFLALLVLLEVVAQLLRWGRPTQTAAAAE